MKNKLLIVALFILGLGSTFVQAQTTPKLGYVDSRAVSDKLPEVKQAYSVLSDFSKAKENELRKEAEAFQKRVEQFEKDAQTMDQKMVTAKERELQAQQEQLQLRQSTAQTEIQNKQKQIFDPIEKRIQDAISQVATENGYTYIFAKEVLLHSPSGDDISDLVVKKLLASAPKQPAAEQKPAAGSSTQSTNTPPKKK